MGTKIAADFSAKAEKDALANQKEAAAYVAKKAGELAGNPGGSKAAIKAKADLAKAKGLLKKAGDVVKTKKAEAKKLQKKVKGAEKAANKAENKLAQKSHKKLKAKVKLQKEVAKANLK